MKKKIVISIIVIIFFFSLCFVGTGFQKREDVALFDYTVSEDGTKLLLGVQVTSSMGQIRGYKDNSDGVKVHYLTFYSTFGGINSSFGTVNTVILEVEENDTEIYFNRPDDEYELVLVKNGETSVWDRPINGSN